ncbi:MAG: hypothetical protein Q4D29_13635 [Lachnospiraceae bacterium]|nr:hypothetical protein [Lachnospiraceae bacterium]
MVANPYEYIAKKQSVNESDLRNCMSMVRIAMILRNYENIDEYDVKYWNELITYFAGDSEDFNSFDSIEDFKEFVLGDYKLQYFNGNIVMLR